jgi:hypothetical protein
MDHVEILFKEYDTLRSEAISRRSEGFQFALIGGAGFAWFTAHTDGKKLWFGLVALAIVYGWIIFCAIRDLTFLSLRIGEIERQINKLSGANLLKWESYWGWPSFRWFGLRRKKPESH